MKPEALRLYVLTDRGLSRGRSDLEVVQAALAGGATAIQLRGKGYSDRELYEVGCRLCAACHAAGALFFVNDRLDIALAVAADGIHLGADDIPLEVARSLAPPPFLIGFSPPGEAELRAAAAAGADYLGVGSVFATATKGDAGPPIGLAGLAAAVGATSLPVVGIGGVNAANAAAVCAAGAVGVAVISAVVAAEDVTAAAARLNTVLGAPGRG